MPDLTETIEQVATEPASFTADGQTATNPDISKLIEADRHLKGKAATAAPNPNGGRTSAWNMGSIGRAQTEGAG